MPNFTDVSAQVVAAGVPVLFLDTCILLDIIRAPLRGLDGCVESAMELAQMADPGNRKCTLVVPSLVADEWHNHVAATTAEIHKHFAKMQEQATRFHDACAGVGISVPFARPAYASVALPDALQRASRQLLDQAIALDAHVDTDLRAFARVVKKQPPARKSQQLKDCAILEECLEVCRCLQTAGFPKKRVLVTSNTNDFCDPGGVLTAVLATEFAALELGFVTNLPWAVHELKS